METATPRKVEHQQTDRGYVPVYATGVVEQPWSSYSRTDHEVWDTLFARQCEMLPGRACQEFLDGVAKFGLGAGGIPKFADINTAFQQAIQRVDEGKESPDEAWDSFLADVERLG